MCEEKEGNVVSLASYMHFGPSVPLIETCFTTHSCSVNTDVFSHLIALNGSYFCTSSPSLHKTFAI